MCVRTVILCIVASRSFIIQKYTQQVGHVIRKLGVFLSANLPGHLNRITPPGV